MTCWLLIDTIAMIGSPALRGAVASVVGAGRACLASRRGAIGLASMPGVTELAAMRGLTESPSVRGAIGLASIPGMTELAAMRGLTELLSVRGVIGLASIRGMTEIASMRGVIGLGSIFGTTVEWRIFHTPPSRTSTSVQRPSTFSGPSCPRPVISYLPTVIAASVPNGET